MARIWIRDVEILVSLRSLQIRILVCSDGAFESNNTRKLSSLENYL